MNIAVLVKQVPDTTEIKVDKETGSLIRKGIPTIINPDDLSAVEGALTLKEQHGGYVHVFTMGPPSAHDMLKELYARGVDETTLLSDRKFAGSDTWATSYVLSTAIGKDTFDLIIAGRQAIDGDTAQVGAQVAEFLNVPHVSYVSQVPEFTQGRLRVVKREETRNLTLSMPTPALITVLDSIATPRYMHMAHIFQSTDKTVNHVTNETLGIDVDFLGLSGSPTKVKRTFNKAVTKKQPTQKLSPEDAAEAIVNFINTQGVVQS